MQIGDLVKSKGFGPNGSVGEVGLIVQCDERFLSHADDFGLPLVWIVKWVSGALGPFSQDGLTLVSGVR